MENPRIRIESDGHTTEVWIDGVKVEKATMAHFVFHAEPFEVYCELEKYLLDKKGIPILINDEPVRDTRVIIDTVRKESKQ